MAASLSRQAAPQGRGGRGPSRGGSAAAARPASPPTGGAWAPSPGPGPGTEGAPPPELVEVDAVHHLHAVPHGGESVTAGRRRGARRAGSLREELGDGGPHGVLTDGVAVAHVAGRGHEHERDLAAGALLVAARRG